MWTQSFYKTFYSLILAEIGVNPQLYLQTILRKLSYDFVTFGSKYLINLSIHKYFQQHKTVCSSYQMNVISFIDMLYTSSQKYSFQSCKIVDKLA